MCLSTIVSPDPRNIGYMGKYESVSARMKRLRINAKLTQEQVAGKLEVSRAAVSKWESGDTKNLKVENLFALADLFGLSDRELWNGSARATPMEGGSSVEPIPRYQDARISAAVELLESTDDRGRDIALAGMKVALSGHQSKSRRKRSG